MCVATSIPAGRSVVQLDRPTAWMTGAAKVWGFLVDSAAQGVPDRLPPGMYVSGMTEREAQTSSRGGQVAWSEETSSASPSANRGRQQRRSLRAIGFRIVAVLLGCLLPLVVLEVA